MIFCDLCRYKQDGTAVCWGDALKGGSCELVDDGGEPVALTGTELVGESAESACGYSSLRAGRISGNPPLYHFKDNP